jgi:hypothetical protein
MPVYRDDEDEERMVTRLRPGLTPYPQNVFAGDQLWLADHLLPLLSIDLGLARPLQPRRRT